MTTENPPVMPADGSELMEMFLPQSPFVQVLGARLDEIGDGWCRIALPFREELTTVGDMVHGAAIAGLIDIAAMVTAWSGGPIPEKLRGVTTSMALEFIDSANAEDIFAEGTLLRRGKTLNNTEVEVKTADGRLVAKAIATYKVG